MYADGIERVFFNRLFKKIKSVGINGGEPFLVKNLPEYVSIIISTLPKLRNVYIITNGYFTEKIVRDSLDINQMCKEKNINYNLSVSIDGIGEMQDKMRGKKGAFDHVLSTCRELNKSISDYCSNFGAICTITKQNVYNLPELEVWAQKENMRIDYNVATIHKRIANESRYNNFSIYTDKKAKMLATEFFYTKFMETMSERYFGLFYLLQKDLRISPCDHSTKAITLSPNGNLSYCATFSNEIGNAIDQKAEDIFFSPKNLQYRKSLHDEHCKSCSHYLYSITGKNFMKSYARERIRLAKIL